MPAERMLLSLYISCFENGDWYNLEELVRQFKLHETKAAIIFEFLAEYGFIELDPKGIEGRLSPRYQTFLKELKGLSNIE